MLFHIGSNEFDAFEVPDWAGIILNPWLFRIREHHRWLVFWVSAEKSVAMCSTFITTTHWYSFFPVSMNLKLVRYLNGPQIWQINDWIRWLWLASIPKHWKTVTMCSNFIVSTNQYWFIEAWMSLPPLSGTKESCNSRGSLIELQNFDRSDDLHPLVSAIGFNVFQLYWVH